MRKLGSLVLMAGLIGVSATSAFAATGGGTTSATVNSMISVAAPATIDFGAGVPGDTLSVLDSTVTVISNNGAGYNLSVQATDLTMTTNTIPLTNLSFREGVTAYAPLVAVATDVSLVTTSAETDADGTDHLIDAQLLLPFVEGGSYDGTFLFTASNL